MKKVLALLVIAVLVISFADLGFAEEKSLGRKWQEFWQGLFDYPARVTEESAEVLGETGEEAVGVVTKEVSRIGEVTSGEFDKTDELITEPVVGTVETVKNAAEGTIMIPSEAAKDAE